MCRREFDGHVWVRAQTGEWWEVRLDPQVCFSSLCESELLSIFLIQTFWFEIQVRSADVNTVCRGCWAWHRRGRSELQVVQRQGPQLFSSLSHEHMLALHPCLGVGKHCTVARVQVAGMCLLRDPQGFVWSIQLGLQQVMPK